MKALVIIGHPAPNSFNHALAARVAAEWERLGAQVVMHDLAAEAFDPCLTPKEARGAPSDDPLVRRHIADLTSADLLAVVHPVMWGMPPAILKGWIDRVFALNAAYGFAQGAVEGTDPIGLLPLRAALVLNTSNTPPETEATRFGDPLERIWVTAFWAIAARPKSPAEPLPLWSPAQMPRAALGWMRRRSWRRPRWPKHNHSRHGVSFFVAFVAQSRDTAR